jgi:hypothetical protein
MSRPVHIAPLDTALNEHLARLAEAEQNQAQVVAKHAEALREIEAAMKARQDAYYAAKSCEDAIRKLGYVVLGVGKDKSRLDGHGGNFREPIIRPTTTEPEGGER